MYGERLRGKTYRVDVPRFAVSVSPVTSFSSMYAGMYISNYRARDYQRYVSTLLPSSLRKPY